MISFVNLDKIEKQKNPAENGDTQQCAADFAALLIAPVQLPNVFVNKPADSNEKTFAETTDNQPKTGVQTAVQVDLQTALPIQINSSHIQITRNVSAESSPPNARNLAIEAQNFTAEIPMSAAAAPEKFDNLETALSEKQIGSNVENDSVEAEKKIFPAKVEALIKAGIESGKIEILDYSDYSDYSENVEAREVFQNDFSEKFAPTSGEKNETSKKLSKFLGEISNLFKNEDSRAPEQIELPTNLDSMVDAKILDSKTKVSEPETIRFNSKKNADSTLAKVESNAGSGEMKTPSSRSETEPPKLEKQSKALENIAVAGFEKIFTFSSKELKITRSVASMSSASSEVLEQIEPRMLQLLALETVETVEKDKKVMKMRLHPAELGTLEIKLEKDASGKLVARLQTESEAAKRVLTEGVEQLRAALQNSGWQIERLEIACSPFSSTEHSDRENRSREFEPVEKRPNNKPASDDSADVSKSHDSNRLLSVRA